MTRTRSVADAFAVAALAALFVAACVPRTGVVVLLPGDGAVDVRAGNDRVTLNEPYAAADVSTAGTSPYRSSPAEIQRLFGSALAAQPAQSSHFTLYFIEGADTLTAESTPVLESAFANIAQRPVPDVVIVGHTDSVGSDAFNDALGMKRAETVRALLIGRGLSPGSVEVTSRGKRQLAVPTPDGVAEARNRRVEIIVR
jgi:outer membrane protein OmpA-like peptidoglycan-associated protein